ncbi:MAG: MFS transporter [Candidatus Micrarchaeia archaeon]
MRLKVGVETVSASELEEKIRASEELENLPMLASHIKVMLISGASFFTDAYDLFVIGIILIMLKPIFSLSAFQLGMLASSALFGAVIGPLIFGTVGDKIGRKYAYWITMLILIIGALGSATSANFISLFIWRFFLGIGIGGDYPLSSTIVAEYANKNDRGKLISSTFAMQGFGIIAGIGIALLLLSVNIPTSIIWRLLLAFGAIPALLIIYARTRLSETPAYNIAKGKIYSAKSTISNLKYGELHAESSNENAKRQRAISFIDFVRKRWQIVIGTSLSWFLMDISYYGTSIFTPYITTLIGFKGVFGPTVASATLLLFSAVPGYWIAVALIDKEGRKPMQAIGFFVIGIAFVALAIFGQALLSKYLLLFFVVYGITFLFTNYGPNTTTYVYPVELYPTDLRARGHGIAALSGKFGAAISALFFPLIIEQIGKFGLLFMLGLIAFIGFAVTVLFLPETKKRSLLETSKELELFMVGELLYSEFTSLSKHIRKVSELLAQEIEDSTLREENFKKIKEEEHLADYTVRKIMYYLTNVKSNTIAYTDISHLAGRLDDIIDAVEAVSARIQIYKVKPTKLMKDFSLTILSSSEIVSSGIVLLNKILQKSSRPQEVSELYKQVSIQENKGDDILRDSLREIMQFKDAKEIIKYKEIYELLESITDRCVDAVDVISDIALRYYNSVK